MVTLKPFEISLGAKSEKCNIAQLGEWDVYMGDSGENSPVYPIHNVLKKLLKFPVRERLFLNTHN